MEGHHNYQAVGGASNTQQESAWDPQHGDRSAGADVRAYGEPVGVHNYQPAQYYNTDSSSNINNTFQNYQQQQPQQQQSYQQTNHYAPGNEGAVGAAYNWSAGGYGQSGVVMYGSDQNTTYPNFYNDPTAGQWTGTAGEYYAPVLDNEGRQESQAMSMGAGSPPDLFSAGPSVENSATSSDFQISTNPDMVPHSAENALENLTAGQSNNNTEHSANQPPDMLAMAGQAPAEPVQVLGAEPEVAGGASGPDIISNGMRGDERTRPDILSPAREDSATAAAAEVGGSRSSSVVLHSPDGAFEPVRSSVSRTGSLSETEPSTHHFLTTGTTAPPLWEQPLLPNVQLQPAIVASPPIVMPVQVLPSTVLQTISTDALSSAANYNAGAAVSTAVSAATTDEVSNLTTQVDRLTLGEDPTYVPTSQPLASQVSLTESHGSTGLAQELSSLPPVTSSAFFTQPQQQEMASSDQSIGGDTSKPPLTAQPPSTPGAVPNTQNFVPIQPSPGAPPQQWPPGNTMSIGSNQSLPYGTPGTQGQALQNMQLPAQNHLGQVLNSNNLQNTNLGQVHGQAPISNSAVGQHPVSAAAGPSGGQPSTGAAVPQSVSTSDTQPVLGSAPAQVPTQYGVSQSQLANSNIGQQGFMGPGQQFQQNIGQGPQNMLNLQNPMMPQVPYGNYQQMQQQQQQQYNMGNQFMNPGMMPNQQMNPGMMPNGMPHTMMGSPMPYSPQQPIYGGVPMSNQMFPPGQNMGYYGNPQSQMFNQMDPQMQQRMAMMKGFKPLTQQQMAGQQTLPHQKPGFSNPAGAPVRATGPLIGLHSQQAYGRQQRSQANPGYYPYEGDQPKGSRNQSYSAGGYANRHNESYNSGYGRDDELRGGYGRPRSRGGYEEGRGGYGYGSRPSSRSGSRPSSRNGSAAPDYDCEIDYHMRVTGSHPSMFQTEVNPYLSMNQSGFSPRPPSRTSSRIDSVYQSNLADSESESDSEPDEPNRMTPAKFPLPHVIPRLLYNGDTLEVQPSQPDDGQPATICVFRRNLYQPSLVKFPGPLIKGQTHKRDVLDYCHKMSLAAKEDSALIDRDSTELLWRFFHLLVKQNGTYIGSDIAELLLDGYDLDGSLYTLSSPSKANMSLEQTVDRFRQLVMFGNTKEALEWAMSSDLWGHALFLSSKMGSRIHAQVLTRFANTSMTHNDPLQTLYQLMSNRQPNATTHPDDGWGTWRPHLAMMLCNPSAEPQLNIKSITALGDALATKGLLHASQFCYLMADLPLEPYTKKAAKLSMLGIQSGVTVEEYTDESAIEMTEVYEYAKSLAGDKEVIPHLQICKFYHTRRLVDRGLPAEALSYLEAISTKVTERPDLFSYYFILQLYHLSEKLKYFDAESVYVREGRVLEVEWITKLGNTLQQKEASSSSAESQTTYQNDDENAEVRADQGSESTDSHLQTNYDYNTAECNTGSDNTGGYTARDNTGGYTVGDNAGGYTVGDKAGGYTVADNTGGYNQQPSTVSHQKNTVEPSQPDYSSGYHNSQQDVTTAHHQVHAWQDQADPRGSQSYENHNSQPPPSSQQGETTAWSQQQQHSQWSQPNNYDTAGQQPYVTQSSQDQADGESSSPTPAEATTDYFDYKPTSSTSSLGGGSYYGSTPSAPAGLPYNGAPQLTSGGSAYGAPQATSGGDSYCAPQIIPGGSTYGAPQATSGGSTYAAPQITSGGGTSVSTRRLSASYPDKIKSGAKPGPASRSLSNSGTSRSLAEQNQPSVETAASANKTENDKPSSSSSKAPATKSKGSGFGFGFGSLFSKILPKSRDEVKLPDDSKQTIIWDDKLKKWVDTESDGTEEVKAAPPPTDIRLGRPSPTLSSSEPGAKGPQTTAGAPPAGNVYSLKRSKGAKYIDVMGKAVGTSLSPIPQHLFDVTPRSTPTSSIFTPTPTTDAEEMGDSDLPTNKAADPYKQHQQQHGQQQQHDQQQYGEQQHGQQQHGQQQYGEQQHGQQHHGDQYNQNQPQQYNNYQQQTVQQHPPQQRQSWNAYQPPSDIQMPRNVSMDSLEVQNIMGGRPPGKLPPLSGIQAPPTAMQTLPTSSIQGSSSASQAPPTSHPPVTNNTQSDGSAVTSDPPPSKPPMFNPAQYKVPLSAPGGRLSSRNRYPK